MCNSGSSCATCTKFRVTTAYVLYLSWHNLGVRQDCVTVPCTMTNTSASYVIINPFIIIIYCDRDVARRSRYLTVILNNSLGMTRLDIQSVERVSVNYNTASRRLHLHFTYTLHSTLRLYVFYFVRIKYTNKNKNRVRIIIRIAYFKREKNNNLI